MKPQLESLDIPKMISNQREFLKAHLWGEWKLRDLPTDQRKKIPQPPLQKPHPADSALIDLIAPIDFKVGKTALVDVIARRRSRREFSEEDFSLEELSYLLWATQGVHGLVREGTATSRTVPSGGARHPFETYIYVQRVQGLKKGLYRYLAVEHKLLFLYDEPSLDERVYKACYQEFVRLAGVVFIWTTIPYRTEWRYSFLAHKVIAQEVGHICQNLYLACESIQAGACALGTYNQDAMDCLLGVDGEDEFTIYIAATGKVK